MIKPPEDHNVPLTTTWKAAETSAGGIISFINPDAYPRTFLASKATRVTDPDQAIDALLNPLIDLRQHSVYQGIVSADDSQSIPGDESSIITTDDPEKIVIDCRTQSQRLLVLEDRMDQGWEVKVDDRPAVPVTANYLFRGVFVPAGRHQVEWTYHAPGLVSGSVTSILTVSGLLCILALTTRRLTLTAKAVRGKSFGLF
jgi:hypothetical protein